VPERRWSTSTCQTSTRAVESYADRKQRMVIELIEAGDFTAYPDALRFLIAVKDRGLAVAAASSSKNANLFLEQIRLDTFAADERISSPYVHPGSTLLDFFDANVNGRDFKHGKPDPEMFLTAAGELRVPPERAFVLEDAAGGRPGRQGRRDGGNWNRSRR
jgi:beta-phosphoglucomutase-like phosphatase (HAD superfamily)